MWAGAQAEGDDNKERTCSSPIQLITSLLPFLPMTLPIPSRKHFFPLALNFKVYTPPFYFLLFSILHHLFGVQSMLSPSHLPTSLCWALPHNTDRLCCFILHPPSLPRVNPAISETSEGSAFLSRCASQASFTPRPGESSRGNCCLCDRANRRCSKSVALLHRSCLGLASGGGPSSFQGSRRIRNNAVMRFCAS